MVFEWSIFDLRFNRNPKNWAKKRYFGYNFIENWSIEKKKTDIRAKNEIYILNVLGAFWEQGVDWKTKYLKKLGASEPGFTNEQFFP